LHSGQKTIVCDIIATEWITQIPPLCWACAGSTPMALPTRLVFDIWSG
jgi:hypothetical protein